MNKSRIVLVLSIAVSLAACGEDAPPAAKGDVIGTTSVEIDTRMITTHTGEAAIGDLFADLFLAEMNALGKGVDVVLMNAGAIRGGPFDFGLGQWSSPEARKGRRYGPGDVTDIDVEGWAPFPDQFQMVSVTGTELKSVLERSAAALPPDLAADKGGWFLQVAGLTYTIDCNQPEQTLTVPDANAIATPGSRVTYIKVGNTVILDTAMAIDDLAAFTAKVGSTDFLFAGGDKHLGLAQAAAGNAGELYNAHNGRNYVGLMKAHLAAQSPIAPATNGRITIVGACGQPLTQP